MTMMARPVVVDPDETTRAELAETIGHLNTAAKALSRRGFVGLMSAEYERAHALIDAVLDDWQAARA